MADVSKRAMEMIVKGSISNHMLSNSAGNHTGEEEKNEIRLFRDYLKTQNGCIVMTMEGHI